MHWLDQKILSAYRKQCSDFFLMKIIASAIWKICFRDKGTVKKNSFIRTGMGIIDRMIEKVTWTLVEEDLEHQLEFESIKMF